MYVETGVPFLLDESDTLLAYEERAKAETLRSDDLLLSCLTSVTPLTSMTSLTSLTHVQQLEVIYSKCGSVIKILSEDVRPYSRILQKTH